MIDLKIVKSQGKYGIYDDTKCLVPCVYFLVDRAIDEFVHFEVENSKMRSYKAFLRNQSTVLEISSYVCQLYEIIKKKQIIEL